MVEPAVMGMEARAGVPGVLQEREEFEVSKMGLLEDQARWGSQGAEDCMGMSP